MKVAMMGVERLQVSDALALLANKAKGGRVFVPGGPVEPVALYEAFARAPDFAAELTFCGMMIPGINTRDWSAIHLDAHAEVFLPAPHLQASIASGQTRVLPIHYSAAWRYLLDASFKAAIFHVCLPDADGQCNLSLSADSSPAFWDRDIFKLGVINLALPHIKGAPSMAFASFDAVVEMDAAPIAIPPAPPSVSVEAIAGHVAEIVENGATLQAGIGKLPSSVMAALAGHKDLRLHSGLIGDWALDLLAAGAFSDAENVLKAGVILGGPDLHKALENEARLQLLPISQTHDGATMARIDRFTSINAALEIDLYGQINCEFAGDKTIAGVGGAADFLRGARASRHGKPIVMIQAEGKGGVSRIVPRLSGPSVSIARSDAPILVTEYGAIDLEPLDVLARANAIIALAAPAHRDQLAHALKDLTP
jgi:acyl-CoA hydrolase